jgi:predicted nucleic acid-binding protein
VEEIFVDTNHFVAVFNPADQWHERALIVEQSLGKITLITTDLIWVEVLNYFSAFRKETKEQISK